MAYEIIQAFLFIFMAEMGDKTQILAMAFATKYPLGKVLLGVMIGSFLNHGLAALLGTYLTVFIPLDLIRLLAAFAFIGFGLWSLKVDDDDDEDNKELSAKFGPVVMVASAFFLGEMGDKTQLTVITLSTTSRYPLLMLVGTVSGMVFTSAIGVFAGSKLGKKIPEVTIKIVSGFVFIFFGLLSLWETVPSQHLTPLNIILFLAVLSFIVWKLISKARSMSGDTLIKRKAHELYLNTKRLQESLHTISNESKECGESCTINCLQEKLKQAEIENKYISKNKWDIPISASNEYDKDKIKVSLLEAIKTCQNCPAHSENCVGSQTREVLERLYFGKNIEFDGDMKQYKKKVQKIDPQFFKQGPS